MKNVIIKYILISISLFPLLFAGSVLAGTYEGYSGVDATVDISVCGDGVVEGPEDCEPYVFITDSCSDVGFDTGELTCDASCSYVTSSCRYLPPKPILPPYPKIYEVPNVIIERNPSVQALPFFLTLYDIDSNGKLNNKEYCDGLSYWLKKWRIRILDESSERDINDIRLSKDTCDLNYDQNCDLKDLSIFLFTATSNG